MNKPVIPDDAVTLSILLVLLALIFRTSQSAHSGWQKFYAYVPALLLFYVFLASLNSQNIVPGESLVLYTV